MNESNAITYLNLASKCMGMPKISNNPGFSRIRYYLTYDDPNLGIRIQYPAGLSVV